MDANLKPLPLPPSILDPQDHGGFDYGATIKKLRKHLFDEEIGYFLGYSGDRDAIRSSIRNLVKNESTPLHHRGEMLWALYCQIFGDKQLFPDLPEDERKPPRSDSQKRGLDDNDFLEKIKARCKKKSPLKRHVRTP